MRFFITLYLCGSITTKKAKFQEKTVLVSQMLGIGLSRHHNQQTHPKSTQNVYQDISLSKFKMAATNNRTLSLYNPRQYCQIMAQP